MAVSDLLLLRPVMAVSDLCQSLQAQKVESAIMQHQRAIGKATYDYSEA
jgi:hypothetical protein